MPKHKSYAKQLVCRGIFQMLMMLKARGCANHTWLWLERLYGVLDTKYICVYVYLLLSDSFSDGLSSSRLCPLANTKRLFGNLLCD